METLNILSAVCGEITRWTPYINITYDGEVGMRGDLAGRDFITHIIHRLAC